MSFWDIFKKKARKTKEKVKKIDEKKKEITSTEEGKPIQIAGKTKAENDLSFSASKIKFSTYNWQKDILWEPVLTEKGQNIVKNENTVVFKVNPKANKSEIKHAVERIFNVKVENVRTGNFKKRLRGRLKIRSKRSAFKKAYIRLAEGSRIAIFE